MRYEDLRVGMRVTVAHRAMSTTDGWHLLWVSEMDACVGGTYTIQRLHGPHLGVSFDPSDDPSAGCRFPASCLEPAQAQPLPRLFTHVNDVLPGMRVRITRATRDDEERTQGWSNGWTRDMTQFVGTTQTVRRVTPAGVYFTTPYGHGYDDAVPWQGFPWFVLEDVSSTPVERPFDPMELARPLTDTDLTGPTLRDSTCLRIPHTDPLRESFGAQYDLDGVWKDAMYYGRLADEVEDENEAEDGVEDEDDGK